VPLNWFKKIWTRPADKKAGLQDPEMDLFIEAGIIRSVDDLGGFTIYCDDHPDELLFFDGAINGEGDGSIGSGTGGSQLRPTDDSMMELFRPLREMGADLAVGPRPDDVGPYSVLHELGSGGMGRVFLAEHRQNGHKVALKVMNPSWCTAEGYQRFKFEAEILASFNHRNIAALQWGSDFNDDRVYVAIQYIKGALPLDQYCDHKSLGLFRRIELILEVCEAIEYVHHFGVIHRDIKPANVLVGDDGIVKLIDFGIARFLNDTTGLTGTGGAPRTLRYSSPEQILGEPPSFRMDVFSVGALLYQLMTGSAPVPGTVADADSIRDFLENGGIPDASDKVLADDDEKVACARGLETLKKLASALRGDLDAVLNKALDFNPEERYPDIKELAADLRNLLKRLPVTARRAPIYRYWVNDVKTHKKTSLGVLVLVVVLSGGWLTSQWRLSQAREERNRAFASAGFLESIFRIYDPVLLRADDLSAWDLLNQAADRLVIYEDQPITKAEVSLSLASIFIETGWLDRADELIQDVLVLDLGGPNSERLMSMANASAANLRCQQGHIDEGEAYAIEAMRLAQEAQSPQAEFYAVGALATVRTMRGDFSEAVRLLETVATSGEYSIVPNSQEQALLSLAGALGGAGRYAEAEKAYSDLVEVQTKAAGGAYSPDLARTWLDFGDHYLGVGDIPNAKSAFVKARRTIETCCGVNHYLVSASIIGLGRCALAQKRYRDALRCFSSAERVARETLGQGADSYIAYAKLFSAQAMILNGDVAGAKEAGNWMLEYGQDSGPYYLGRGREVLGICAQIQGDHQLALSLLNQALEDLQMCYGLDHPDMNSVLTNIAFSLDKLGKTEEAIPYLEREVAICDHWYGTDHELSSEAKNRLAEYQNRR